jgi:biopolymer transport protein ExbD
MFQELYRVVRSYRYEKKRSQVPPSDEPNLDVSSLVDVSVLLLIFFLVTATIMKKENELTMTAPTIDGPQLPAPPIVRVTVEGDGKVTLGGMEGAELMLASVSDHELPKLAQRIQLIQSISDQKTPFQVRVQMSLPTKGLPMC